MSDISTEQLNKFLAKAGIAVAGSELDIGHELSFRNGPTRTIVIHFAESDFPVHFKKTMETILSVEPRWFLVPRESVYMASFFKNGELSLLIDRLISHLPSLTNVGEDLYLVGESGSIIVFYDHHFKEDGLEIDFSDIEKAGFLLSQLNELGSEVELLSNQT